MFAVFKGTNAQGHSTGPDAHEALERAHRSATEAGNKAGGEAPPPSSGDLQRFVLRGAAFGHWLSCKDVSWASVSDPGSGQRAHLALCGEIENEAEIAELYSIPRADDPSDNGALPPAEGAEGEGGGSPSFYSYSSSGAKLLLDLYWKGFSDAYGDYSAQPETCLASLEGCWSFCLFDESSGYILTAASLQSSPGSTLFWASCPSTGDVSVTTAGLVDLLDRSTVSEFPRGSFYVKSLCNPGGEIASFLHEPAAMETEGADQGGLCGIVFRVASGSDIAGLHAGTDIQAQ